MQPSHKPLLQKIDQLLERIDRELEEESLLKNAAPLDRVFNEKPVLGPRTKYEQRARWKQALKEDLSLEKTSVGTLKGHHGDLLVDLICKEHYPELYKEGSIEQTLKYLAHTRDFLFCTMHRIAYVEGLLNAENIEYIFSSEDCDSL